MRFNIFVVLCSAVSFQDAAAPGRSDLWLVLCVRACVCVYERIMWLMRNTTAAVGTGGGGWAATVPRRRPRRQHQSSRAYHVCAYIYIIRAHDCCSYDKYNARTACIIIRALCARTRVHYTGCCYSTHVKSSGLSWTFSTHYDNDMTTWWTFYLRRTLQAIIIV